MKTHIAIIDGTLSRLENGKETHAGQVFKLALRMPPDTRKIFYDPGVQGVGLQKYLQVASGTGLNISIIKIYQKLSQHYVDGDKIYLFGYSRGAYAIRLIAGMIGRIGLLKPEFATYDHAQLVLRLYANRKQEPVWRDFREAYCRDQVSIEFLGVWDTVKALGIKFPFLHHLTPLKIEFRDLSVPRIVKVACHALAKDEDRWIYEPELWASAAPGTKLQQMLFSGDHAVVGGHILRNQDVRKLSNFSMIWMLNEAEKAGLKLPDHWMEKFPTDPCAPDDDDLFWYERLWLKKPRRFNPPEYFKEHPSISARKNCP